MIIGAYVYKQICLYFLSIQQLLTIFVAIYKTFKNTDTLVKLSVSTFWVILFFLYCVKRYAILR